MGSTRIIGCTRNPRGVRGRRVRREGTEAEPGLAGCRPFPRWKSTRTPLVAVQLAGPVTDLQDVRTLSESYRDRPRCVEQSLLCSAYSSGVGDLGEPRQLDADFPITVLPHYFATSTPRVTSRWAPVTPSECSPRRHAPSLERVVPPWALTVLMSCRPQPCPPCRRRRAADGPTKCGRNEHEEGRAAPQQQGKDRSSQLARQCSSCS